MLAEAERQLAEYFAGRRTKFSLKLDFAGTAFQRKVWNALLTIPFGETRSYTEIARQIGSRVLRGPSAPPTAGTRFRSWPHAIASSAPAAS